MTPEPISVTLETEQETITDETGLESQRYNFSNYRPREVD